MTFACCRTHPRYASRPHTVRVRFVRPLDLLSEPSKQRQATTSQTEASRVDYSSQTSPRRASPSYRWVMFLLSFLSWSDLLVGLAILSISLFVYQFYIAPNTTSYANLPGPPLDSYLWGNMQRLVKCVRFSSGASCETSSDPLGSSQTFPLRRQILNLWTRRSVAGWNEQVRAWSRPREHGARVRQDAAVCRVHGCTSLPPELSSSTGECSILILVA